MNKWKKILLAFNIIFFAAIVLSVLGGFFSGDFTFNRLEISNAILFVAIGAATAGGVLMLLPFFKLKSKLRKTKLWEEVDVDPAPELPWHYILIAVSISMLFVSYAVAVL